MKSVIRSIVLAGVVMSSTGVAFATVGGGAPTPRPQSQQSALATAISYALSFIGL